MWTHHTAILFLSNGLNILTSSSHLITMIQNRRKYKYIRMNFSIHILKTNLVEAAMEDFFYFISFKGDGLEVSFVVIVEECQGLSRVCGGTQLMVKEDSNLTCTHYCLCLPLFDCNEDLVCNNSDLHRLININNKQQFIKINFTIIKVLSSSYVILRYKRTDLISL